MNLFFPPVLVLYPLLFDNMIVVLKISSRSRLNILHHVIIDTEKKTVNCDCEAFKFIGRCSHIKFYKVLIWRLLHEIPRVLKKKGGK